MGWLIAILGSALVAIMLVARRKERLWQNREPGYQRRGRRGRPF
jgi:hypothetical protein